MRLVKFIYNPASGENSVVSRLDAIAELYQRRGYALVLHRLDFKHAAEEEEAMLRGIDDSYHHILIAGGDGTLNFVVNAGIKF